MKIFGEVSEYDICMVCNYGLQLNIVTLQKKLGMGDKTQLMRAALGFAACQSKKAQ